LQSNHARTTAIVARRRGLDCHLILRGKKGQALDGNYLLDSLVDAKVTFVTKGKYLKREQIFDTLEKKLVEQRKRPYSIPEGGSNGLGAIGYVRAMEEIRDQMAQMGVVFDAIVSAVGSGGTYAGLLVGKKIFDIEAEVIGFNVAATAQYFLKEIYRCTEDIENLTGMGFDSIGNHIDIVDGYVGKGYARSRSEEVALMKHVARLEGIILDPVYTARPCTV
jgi:D-cysteine desulfhydrase